MPTLVRYVCKVALFVLAIAVSGVSAAHAQTDPEPALPTEEGELIAPSIEDLTKGRLKPDLIEKSARLYGTGEQLTTGGQGATGDATYWMPVDFGFSSEHPPIEARAVWHLYRINGEEDPFFIESIGTANINPEAHPIAPYTLTEFEPYVRSLDENTKVMLWDPTIAETLPATGKTTFNVKYAKDGIDAGVTTEIPRTIGTLDPSVTGSGRWFSVGWRGYNRGNDGRRYAVGISSVSQWVGDYRDLRVGMCGKYEERLPPVPWIKSWGHCSDRE